MRMKNFNRIFLSGLFGILPLLLTLYLIYSLVLIFELNFRKVLPEFIYFPGLGLLLGIVVIFGFGLMLDNFVTAKAIRWFEVRIASVPFIKAIYSPLKDVMNLFSKRDAQLGYPVLVQLDNGVQIMGLVTRDPISESTLGENKLDHVAVYCPMSYAIGGYTIVVKRSQLTPLSIPIEQAMTLAITGWVKTEQNQKGTKL